MPTEFDVETGCDLSPKLAGFVNKLAAWLKSKRDADEITPDRPIKADDIIDYAIQYHHLPIKDSDVRAMVNFLRRSKQPIGSAAGGYFWAVNHQELRSTLEHLHERIRSMSVAANGLKFADFGEPRLL